mmetsp:Transcript_41493/g.65813  ORF Transcript_41493/g.65813 Transcript_41493/m.65813 type:complete len:240 (+) Transcript_41493:97-816(+)
MRTINRFLCGCPLPFGVGVIIAVNLAQNLFTIVTVVCNIIFRVPTFGANEPLALQTFNCGLAVLGLPFIIGAILGLYLKQESNMRLYLYYLVACLCIEIPFALSFLISADSCADDNLPRSLRRHGAAFACGFVRIFTVFMTAAMIVVSCYCAYTIWSYCEDLKVGGGGAGFPALQQYAEEQPMRKKLQKEYNSVFAGNAAETIAKHENANKLGHDFSGSQRIFKGHFHETQYPPPAYMH